MNNSAQSLADLLPRFVAAQTAKGVSEKTIRMYHEHFHCIGRHLDVSRPIDALTQEDLENLVVSFRSSGLSHNSISSYSRVLRTMLKWCREMGYTDLQMPPIKDRETVKETYTDEELKLLLRKPLKDSGFCEYRNWVIVNFLLNSGCRASTLRSIQNRDIDLSSRQASYRHTKTGKAQIIPLCTDIIAVFVFNACVVVFFLNVLHTDGVGLVGIGIEIVPKNDKPFADGASVVPVHRLPLRCWMLLFYHRRRKKKRAERLKM